MPKYSVSHYCPGSVPECAGPLGAGAATLTLGNVVLCVKLCNFHCLVCYLFHVCLLLCLTMSDNCLDSTAQPLTISQDSVNIESALYSVGIQDLEPSMSRHLSLLEERGVNSAGGCSNDSHSGQGSGLAQFLTPFC